MRSKIALKLTLWIALLCILSSSTSVYVTYTQSRALLIAAAQEKLVTANRSLATRFSFFMRNVETDLNFIAQLPAVNEILTNQDRAVYESRRARLGLALTRFLESHEEYIQVRLIGASEYGREIVRIDKHQEKISVVNAIALQEKKHFSYVYNTLSLPQGQVYVSSIKLNKERGLIDGYGRPSIIMAIPVFTDSNQAVAVVVINVDMEKMFELIETDVPADIDIIATNSQGDFIIHPDPDKSFGFDKGSRVFIQTDIDATQALFSGAVNQLITTINDLHQPDKKAVLSLVKVPFSSAADEKYITLGLVENLDQVLAESRYLGMQVLKITSLFSVFFVLLSLVLARSFSLPIQRMANTFARFQKGESLPELDEQRNDEIGLLARNFSLMAKKLNSQLVELNNKHNYLHRAAHHDSLTALPNRILLHDRIEQAMINARRERAEVALLLIDLDKFKPVNDTHGHTIGDSLLKECAKRMLGCTRDTDTVARYGGDEFMVVISTRETYLRGINARHIARQVADKIRHELNQPFLLAGHSLTISCSIGIAIYPQDGEDQHNLIQHADQAMYCAKSLGGNRVKLYDDTHN